MWLYLAWENGKGLPILRCNSQYKKITTTIWQVFVVTPLTKQFGQWLKHQLQHPELIAAGIREEQKTRAKATKPLQEDYLSLKIC